MVNSDGNSLAPNWRPPQFNVNVFGCLDEGLDTTEEVMVNMVLIH